MQELKTNIHQLLIDIENNDSLYIYIGTTNLKLDKDDFLWRTKHYPFEFEHYYTYIVKNDFVFIDNIKELHRKV